jgi:ribonuclease HI
MTLSIICDNTLLRTFIECQAVITGLEKVVCLGLHNIIVFNDSRSLIKRLNKKTPGKTKHKETYKAILSFHDKINNLGFQEVRRSASKTADHLVQIAYENNRFEEIYFEESDDLELYKILKKEKERDQLKMKIAPLI